MGQAREGSQPEGGVARLPRKNPINPSTAAAPNDVQALVGELVQRARTAQRIAEGYDQARVDELVAAAGWAIIEPARNRALAELAVADTGIGNVADKIAQEPPQDARPAARPERRAHRSA